MKQRIPTLDKFISESNIEEMKHTSKTGYDIEHTTSSRTILNPEKEIYDEFEKEMNNKSFMSARQLPKHLQTKLAFMLGNPNEKVYGDLTLKDGTIKISN